MLALKPKPKERIRLFIDGVEIGSILTHLPAKETRIGLDFDPSVSIIRDSIIEKDPGLKSTLQLRDQKS